MIRSFRVFDVSISSLLAPYAGVLMTRPVMRLSTAKAKEELGWRPSVTGYREGLARTRETTG